MIKVFIEPLNYLVSVTNNRIIKLVFTDPYVYRKFCFDVKHNLTFSIDNEIIDLDKFSFIIYNPFELCFSDKKIIMALYKRIEKEMNDDEKRVVQKIDELAIRFFELMQLKIGYTLDFKDHMDLTKFFSSFNLSFMEQENENYLQTLCQYFLICSDFFNTKLFITFGLTNLLTTDEKELLNKELQQYDLVLIDISFSDHDQSPTLMIDQDWCII